MDTYYKNERIQYGMFVLVSIHPGFTSVLTWQAIAAEENLPACTKGEQLSINEVRMHAGGR